MPIDPNIFNNYKGFADYQRAEEEFQLKKQLANNMATKLSNGSNLPAALQLANEYQKRISAGDIEGANLLAQFAKTVDRGVVTGPDGTYQAAPGYGPAIASIEGAKAGAGQNARNASDLGYKPKIKVATDTAESATKKTIQANDTLSILDEIEAPDASGQSILDKATGSTLGAGIAAGKKVFGVSDQSTQANAALTVYGNRLVNNVPRMEGPQSDADRDFYIAQAGKIADPMVPAPDKKAAIAAIRQLNQKYSGNINNLDDLLNNYQPSPPAQSSPVQPTPASPQTLYDKSNADFMAAKVATPEEIAAYKAARGIK